MRVAVDISPLQSGHKVRGVGSYLRYLKRYLESSNSPHEFLFFSESNNVPKNADVVHFPYFDPFFLTLPGGNAHKTVVTVHDMIPLKFPEHFPAGIKGRLRWQMQKYRVKRVGAIITDSESSKKDIVQILGYPEDKVEVIYLAAGDEFREMKKAELDKLDLFKKYSLPAKFVLYVGDGTWNKNLPRLVKAIQELKIPLVMVGSALSKPVIGDSVWSRDISELQRVTAGDKLFHMIGFVPSEDLVGLYNLASVTAMPSLYEGFGLPVLEAMKSGCPVVTTAGGSLKEVAGNATRYVDPNDIESIAKGIGDVYFNDKTARILSEKGREQVKKFSWKKTVEETIKVYNKVYSI